MNMADELFQTGIFDGMTWWNTNPTKNFFSGGGLSSPYCSTAAGGDGLGMAWSTLSKSNSVSLFDDPSMVDSSNTLQAMGFDDVSWSHQPIINGDYVNTMIQAEEWSSSPPAAMNSAGNSSGTDGSTLSCDALAVVNSFPIDPSSLFTNTILNQEHEILAPCDWTHNGNDQVLGSSFDNHQQQQQIINHIRATLLGGSPAPSLPPSPKPQTRKTTNAKANKREEGSDSEPSIKRQRIETPSPLPTFKVRKEKLGDRITALQQLVSPFGKTDTASVLHEAIEYIKFLHDQVNGLSTPYTKNGAPIQHHHQHKQQAKGEATNQDLRSRGLCLVPISSTFPVAHETPADFWTPTFR